MYNVFTVALSTGEGMVVYNNHNGSVVPLLIVFDCYYFCGILIHVPTFPGDGNK